MFRRLAAYQNLVPLLLRIVVGLIFVVSGYGKLVGGVDRVAGFFGSLGIPLPNLMAPFITYLELFGGIALMAGALTRLFSMLFVCNMAVALLTAKVPQLAEAGGLVAGFGEIRLELLLLVASACLALLGAGKLSVDALLGERLRPAPERPLRT